MATPPDADKDGFHWLRWRTGALTIGQWSADCQAWVVNYLGKIASPDELDHLEYVGRIEPPANLPPCNVIRFKGIA